MLLHYLGKANQAKYAICVKINRKFEKKHPHHYRSYLEQRLADFHNILQKYFWYNWLLNKCVIFLPHSTFAFALPGESRPGMIRVKTNGKMSINSICLNRWAPTADLLQGLTVLQQCVYQMKFRNVCKVKKWLAEPVLVWSRTLSILLSSEWRKRLLACVRIVGQRFKQFHGRQLKNG